MATQNSEIKFTIKLDENNIPDEIVWEAEGAGIEKRKANSLLISVWDPEEKNTLKVDLWTKDMYVEEMKQFIHQTIMLMADTYEKATSEADMAKEIRLFGKLFGERNGLFDTDDNGNGTEQK